MTGYLRAATACHALTVLATTSTVWLAIHGHPWLAVLTGWVAFLALFFSGPLHLGHHRTIAHNQRKETTTS